MKIRSLAPIIWVVVCLAVATGIPPSRADELPADEVPGVVVTPILATTRTASGQRIEVPAQPEVIVDRYEIAPGIALPMHRHPYPRYA